VRRSRMHSGRDGVDRCLVGVDRYSPLSFNKTG